jgi:hypothetical protein
VIPEQLLGRGELCERGEQVGVVLDRLRLYDDLRPSFVRKSEVVAAEAVAGSVG